eukprot:306560_1
MSAEASNMQTLTRPKLTNKKSWREKLNLFSFTQPKETKSKLPKLEKPKLMNSHSCQPRPSCNYKMITTRRQTLSEIDIDFDANNLIVLDHSSRTNNLKMKHKSQWKPSLDHICNHQRLLSALITFMTRSYNEENIFFLQSVQEFKAKFHGPKSNEIQIDENVQLLFERYIAHSAEYQINLSYSCCQYTTNMCRVQLLSTLSMHQKQVIFDSAVDEVSRLMVDAVLGRFYDSHEFQSVAQCNRKAYTTPPIILNMSRSTLSVDIPVITESETYDIVDMDEMDVDGMVYMDDEYFNTSSCRSSMSFHD